MAKTTRKTTKTAQSATKRVKKHVGDVLGISRARVQKAASSTRASGRKKSSGRRPKGIDVAPRRTLKRAGVVGGVRGRGR